MLAPMAEQAATSGLTLTVDAVGHEVTVHCRGRLVLGTTGLLYDEVKPRLESARHIVIDCAELVRLDSTGIGTLVRLYVSAKGKGCTLEMIDLGPSIRQLLGVTQLLHVLTTIGENNIRMV